MPKRTRGSQYMRDFPIWDVLFLKILYISKNGMKHHAEFMCPDSCCDLYAHKSVAKVRCCSIYTSTSIESPEILNDMSNCLKVRQHLQFYYRRSYLHTPPVMDHFLLAEHIEILSTPYTYTLFTKTGRDDMIELNYTTTKEKYLHAFPSRNRPTSNSMPN